MNYVYTAIETNDISLAHHGIKGQKWGIRRYQNEDGSLTDEGYRHYGYGKRGLFAPNTKSKMKTGAKVGATAGAAIGVTDAAAAGLLLAGVYPPAALAVAGATSIALWTAHGALTGLGYGAIAGAATTHAGRQAIENDPALKTKLKDFQEREFQND